MKEVHPCPSPTQPYRHSSTAVSSDYIPNFSKPSPHAEMLEMQQVHRGQLFLVEVDLPFSVPASACMTSQSPSYNHDTMCFHL